MSPVLYSVFRRSGSMVSRISAAALTTLLAFALPSLSSASGNGENGEGVESTSGSESADPLPDPITVRLPFEWDSKHFADLSFGPHPFFESDRIGYSPFRLDVDFSYETKCTHLSGCRALNDVVRRPDASTLTPNDITPVLSVLQPEEGDGVLPYYLAHSSWFTFIGVMEAFRSTLGFTVRMGSAADFVMFTPSRETLDLEKLQFDTDGSLRLPEGQSLERTIQEVSPLVAGEIYAHGHKIVGLTLENKREFSFFYSYGFPLPRGEALRFSFDVGYRHRSVLDYHIFFPEFTVQSTNPAMANLQGVYQALQFEFPSARMFDVATTYASFAGSLVLLDAGKSTLYMGVGEFTKHTRGRVGDQVYLVPQDPVRIYAGLLTSLVDTATHDVDTAQCGVYSALFILPDTQTDTHFAGGCSFRPHPLIGVKAYGGFGTRERNGQVEVTFRMPFSELDYPVPLDAEFYFHIKGGQRFLEDQTGRRNWVPDSALMLRIDFHVGGKMLEESAFETRYNNGYK